jgi:diguanylate cyclase (GGDEF)-like protein/PAS domain S-box-containing protein
MSIAHLINKYKILYAEDDLVVQKHMLKTFGDIFAKIDIAQNGEEALELYTQSLYNNSPYDIVFSDINMPKMDGVTLSQKIKELNLSQQIVIISAHNESELLQSLINININFYLYKPIKFDKLIEILIKLDQELQIQKELEKNNHLYTIYNSNVLSVQLDLDRKIIYTSEPYEQMCCRSSEDLKGLEFDHIFDKLISKGLVYKIQTSLEQNAPWVGEIKLCNCKDQSYWVKAFIFPIFDKYNNKTGYSAIYENIDEKKKLEILSNTDSLTKLYNRRFFDEMIQKQINIKKRKKEALVFMMIDIDYFKQYNDYYGHQMGDIVLQKVAHSLQLSLERANDYCFRLGGEEFGILCDVEKKDSLATVSEKVRKNVYNLQIEHKKSQIEHFVTISLGVVSFSKDQYITPQEVYQKADELLYEAKNNGRNKAVILIDGEKYE